MPTLEKAFSAPLLELFVLVKPCLSCAKQTTQWEEFGGWVWVPIGVGKRDSCYLTPAASAAMHLAWPSLSVRCCTLNGVNGPIGIADLQNQGWGSGSLPGTEETSLLVELLPPAAVPLLSGAADPCPRTSAGGLVLESPPALGSAAGFGCCRGHGVEDTGGFVQVWLWVSQTRAAGTAQGGCAAVAWPVQVASSFSFAFLASVVALAAPRASVVGRSSACSPSCAGAPLQPSPTADWGLGTCWSDASLARDLPPWAPLITAQPPDAVGDRITASPARGVPAMCIGTAWGVLCCVIQGSHGSWGGSGAACPALSRMGKVVGGTGSGVRCWESWLALCFS